MIGRESLYLYKGEYGNTFGYGINQVYEIKQFDTKWKIQCKLPPKTK